MDRVRNKVPRRAAVTGECVGRGERSVLRQMEDRLVKRIVVSDVSGVRLTERPRTGWMDGVKRALNERVMSVEKGRMTLCMIEVNGNKW